MLGVDSMHRRISCLSLAVLIGFSCAITGSAEATPPTPTLVVAGYDAARTGGAWGLHETYFTNVRSYITTAADYGPSGIVNATYTIGTPISVASATSLSGVDVFVTGYVRTNSYTAAEKDALLDFVLDGGCLIGTTDSTSFNMADVFGVTHGGGAPGSNTVTNTTHPVADGPFGTVTNYTQYFVIGYYSDLGSDAIEIGENARGTSLAVIEPGQLGAGSGAVVLIADVDVMSNAGAGSVVNKKLIQNIFAWIANSKDSDGDGVPDVDDECPNSILTATVVIDGCDSGVTNTLFDDGCTMADLLAECAEDAKNHGQYVSCVAKLTNGWKKDGDITGKQKGAIQSCAAKAELP